MPRIIAPKAEACLRQATEYAVIGVTYAGPYRLNAVETLPWLERIGGNIRERRGRQMNEAGAAWLLIAYNLS